MEDWVGDLKFGEMEYVCVMFVMNMIMDVIFLINVLVINLVVKKCVIDSGGLLLIKGL